MERLVTPEMLNNLNKANDELNKLLGLIITDHMDFDHLCSKEYWTNLVIPTYKSDLKLYDVRVIDNDIVDIETDRFIITFHRKSEDEGVTSSTYSMINDIEVLTGSIAEVEIESGYMDEMLIYPLANKNEYHFIKA